MDRTRKMYREMPTIERSWRACAHFSRRSPKPWHTGMYMSS